ncbi:MAG: class I SAM-dependent methyltransferase [Burkholderiaceae bacterium]
MTSGITISDTNERPAQKVPRAATTMLRMLDRLQDGQLNLRLPDGQTRHFGEGHPQIMMDVKQWQVFDDILKNGDIGFAEAFIRGDWDTEDLAPTLEFVVANRTRLEQAVYGSLLGRLVNRVRHLLNRNTRSGAKRNIHAHYDLGNAFYELWLDPSMTYSSALFDDAQSSDASTDAGRDWPLLAQAQQAKYDRMLAQTGCTSGDKILEIGCGWGGFAQTAVQKGIAVKGLTLSSEQLAFAQKRLADAGMGANTELALQDYRDEQTLFDGIVSIEMFEAVGEPYWSSYFETIKRCLKPQAKAVVQTITIADELFDRYRTGSDFIQQYIFPGGMLPSPQVFRRQAGKAGLKVSGEHAFGLDYARTLACWREKFLAQTVAVDALGFDERFKRTWLFYLAYCEAAFLRRNTDVIQFTLEHE